MLKCRDPRKFQFSKQRTCFAAGGVVDLVFLHAAKIHEREVLRWVQTDPRLLFRITVGMLLAVLRPKSRETGLSECEAS
jgi:hypothetical protein